MLYHDKEWLSEQYNTNQLSPAEIGRLCDAGATTIRKYLKRFKIAMRSGSEAARISNQKIGPKISAYLTTRWADPAYRDKQIAARHRRNELYQSQQFRSKMAKLCKDHWNQPRYRQTGEKHLRKIQGSGTAAAITTLRSEQSRAKMAAISKQIWSDPLFRSKMLSIFASDQYCTNHKAAMADPSYRTLCSKLSKLRWSDPLYRGKMLAIIRSEEYRIKLATIRSQMPKVSCLQDTLYGILDDLQVSYYREYNDRPADPQCQIGPYLFDCVVPRAGQRTLLIECNGDYWHNLPEASRRDAAKSSYVITNLAHLYELKFLWEHEFKNLQKISDTIKYWLGIRDFPLIEFDFKDVEIKPCPADDYRPLLGKYHYLPSAGRGGIAYGAYLGSTLAGVCIFSTLVRQNINTGTFTPAQCRELSRFCIHPHYRKQNFGSWMIAQCIKQLPLQIRRIISYCDTTFNHDGTLYKAANFSLDGTVPPDYWYVAADGWVIHKKTLYNHANKLHQTEKQFAANHGYHKVYGLEKHRYIYTR